MVCIPALHLWNVKCEWRGGVEVQGTLVWVTRIGVHIHVPQIREVGGDILSGWLVQAAHRISGWFEMNDFFPW